jgi:hypothetical protein
MGKEAGPAPAPVRGEWNPLGVQQVKGQGRLAVSPFHLRDFSALLYANRLRSLGPLFDLEVHTLAILQTLEAFAFYGAMVNEVFFPGIIRDKAVALLIAEPFYCAMHFENPLVTPAA